MEFLEVLQNIVPLAIPANIAAIFAVPVLIGILVALPAYLSIRH